MNRITTYYCTRRNVFLWLAAIAAVCSAVARLVFVFGSGSRAEMHPNPIIFILMPIVANLIIAIRLPWRGEKQFYVSILPVALLSIYMALAGKHGAAEVVSPILGTAIIAGFLLLYFITFSGRLGTKYIVLIYFVAACALAAYYEPLRELCLEVFRSKMWLAISDGAILVSVCMLLLSVRKMPPYKEGDPYRLRFGDRLDGRRVNGAPVVSKVTPYFMPTRISRANYASNTLELTHVEKYIQHKRNEGYKNFSIMHILVAAYVRTVAEMPELNRFIAGQRIYHRFDLSVNMVVKKEMTKESPDSSIKVFFNPSDTAAEVYEKFNAAMEEAREEGVSNEYDSITGILNYIPNIVMAFFGCLVRVLDYFSILPMALERVSPFHASLFITSMGSLGIPPIYHHLYNLGTVPLFCAFGHKYTKYEFDKDGEPRKRKYVDYKVVCDEGICDGFYYASAFKKWKSYMSHPERLDLPPEKVVEDIL